MKLVAGSYERFLWGWVAHTKKSQLNLDFSYPAHLGPIKCAAACGSVVASGGTDDTIKVFDVNALKDMGSLYLHTGSITCLTFHGLLNSVHNHHPTHLLSGSDDGTIGIWDTDSWVHLKTMKGHKSAVNSLSVHQSGRVLISVEKDAHLKMWNILKGRCSFTTKLASEGSLIKFSPQTGDSYSLVRGETIEIFNVEDGRLLHSFPGDKNVLCLAQHEDRLLISGGEDCAVRGWDTRSGKNAFSFSNAHLTRIKGVAVLSSNQASVESSSHTIASASSDGMLRIWDTRLLQNADSLTPLPVVEYATKARLTCLVCCSHAKTTVHGNEEERLMEDDGKVKALKVMSKNLPVQKGQGKRIKFAGEDTVKMAMEKLDRSQRDKAGKKKMKQKALQSQETDTTVGMKRRKGQGTAY